MNHRVAFTIIGFWCGAPNNTTRPKCEESAASVCGKLKTMTQSFEDQNVRVELDKLSRHLRDLHRRILAVEREFQPGVQGLALLDRLVNDPSWAWLRPLSELISNIDHVLASREPVRAMDAAVVAGQLRSLLSGSQLDEPFNTDASGAFATRYRALLQSDATLASMHGELKMVLATLPAESELEAERLHARHQWAMRCKHRVPH